MRTTLPRNCSRVSGGELSHSTAPSSDGALPSTGSSERAAAALALAPAAVAASGALAVWRRSSTCCSKDAVLA
ncbi:LPXTG cell wall anchor domain-containing protein [Agrobacterium tumefaciens]|uniref:LPXTG cell wall anchor domain-containing protein n=1 Tax=Agrobacterium tumefaciens TaxID=358 RepID=UPI0039A6A049